MNFKREESIKRSISVLKFSPPFGVTHRTVRKDSGEQRVGKCCGQKEWAQ